MLKPFLAHPHRSTISSLGLLSGQLFPWLEDVKSWELTPLGFPFHFFKRSFGPPFPHSTRQNSGTQQKQNAVWICVKKTEYFLLSILNQIYFPAFTSSAIHFNLETSTNDLFWCAPFLEFGGMATLQQSCQQAAHRGQMPVRFPNTLDGARLTRLPHQACAIFHRPQIHGPRGNHYRLHEKSAGWWFQPSETNGAGHSATPNDAWSILKQIPKNRVRTMWFGVGILKKPRLTGARLK